MHTHTKYYHKFCSVTIKEATCDPINMKSCFYTITNYGVRNFQMLFDNSLISNRLQTVSSIISQVY